MKKKIIIWSTSFVLFSALVFALGRASRNRPPKPDVHNLPAYSLSLGVTGMLDGGAGYVYDSVSSNVVPVEELIAAVQHYLDWQNNPDLQLAHMREFRWAFLVEAVERSTGRYAFGMMVSKVTAQISPEVGPNLLWNTKYGSMIAEVGGGYGMVGRLLPEDPVGEMPLAESEARKIAENAVEMLDAGLKLGDEVAVFYGFYEFYLIHQGELVGELDVNGYSGQAWVKDWGEQQQSFYDLTKSE
jgi:hypothetical protein